MRKMTMTLTKITTMLTMESAAEHVLGSVKRVVSGNYSPRPCLLVDMGLIIVQTFLFGSKHSTVLSVFRPSLPPTTYNRLSKTAMPNWRRLPFMLATCVHWFDLRS